MTEHAASGASTAPNDDTPTGGVLGEGRYHLGEVLGAGGMGIVYRATDRLLDREVAVKLLADNLSAIPDARERFQQEARAAASVVDPNVVAVYDVGQDGDRPYIVMELVDGPSLAEVLRRSGPLDPDTVASITADALRGLDRAHAAGLLHRDVKPGNLLRGPDGTVKVTDFGVAQAIDAPGLTRTGMVIGTGAYLAPERLRGGQATVATDLYALGVTCVQLLHGAPPHPDRPLRLRDDTPASLASVVLSLAAPDPGHRPASAADALRLLEDGPPRAHRVDDATAELAPTQALTVARLPAQASPEAATPADEEAHSRTSAHTHAPRGRRVLLGGAAAAATAGVLVASLAMGEPGATVESAPTDGETLEAEGVERVEDDPAATLRNLAEWLDSQGG